MKITKFMVLPVALAMIALGTIGTASAQVAAPRVAIQLATSGLTSPLVASTDDAVVARLILDTTGSAEAVRISSLPFIMSAGNGAIASTLENCRVYNEANSSVDLNTVSSGTSNISTGVNSIALNNALVLNPNTVTTLGLRCDIGSNLVANGTYTFSMNTANVSGTGVTTGLPAVVTVRGAVVNPPVVNPPVVNPPVYTPGMPATGADGDTARNLAIIFGSIVVAGFGLAYAKKHQSVNA